MACLSLLSGVHPLPLLLLITLLGPVALVRGVTFRVVNKCPFPVWPAAAPNAGHPVLAGGGFLLPPGQSRRVSAPPTWNGRFWGRTGCNFTSTATNHHGNAAASCLTGDCGGRLACNGTARRPLRATLVEPPTPGAAAADRKCVIPGCAKNVNAVCPPELQVTAAAAVVACKSACVAFGTDAFCCRGAHGTAETCRGSAYSRVFRDACPAYVSYPYDTAAARCYAEVYVLTFCPSRWGAGADRVAQA
ncbi:hypothetical protein OsJ_11616 [Oryza sativa Japonica Group]|uniref:Thaumatin-like protein n=1 Tax=Oryza sativa subsp. japonica TaxID=39947 RepID=B9F9J3_ORYSJ|nr:hypothetical protein OsJ_11616 [Oryza sativa Japonica Group]